MSQSGRTRSLGSIFESVTGQSSCKERQHIEPPLHYPDRTADQDVAAYVHAMARDDGLAEAIDTPDWSRSI